MTAKKSGVQSLSVLTPIEKAPGIGVAFAKAFRAKGIKTVGDLIRAEDNDVESIFLPRFPVATVMLAVHKELGGKYRVKALLDKMDREALDGTQPRVKSQLEDMMDREAIAAALDASKKVFGPEQVPGVVTPKEVVEVLQKAKKLDADTVEKCKGLVLVEEEKVPPFTGSGKIPRRVPRTVRTTFVRGAHTVKEVLAESALQADDQEFIAGVRERELAGRLQKLGIVKPQEVIKVRDLTPDEIESEGWVSELEGLRKLHDETLDYNKHLLKRLRRTSKIYAALGGGLFVSLVLWVVTLAKTL